MSSKQFASHLFLWLRQVAADCRDLPPLASAVAAALTKYFNEDEGGAAWMTLETLSKKELGGLTERTIRKTMAGMEARGHLRRKIAHGRHTSNTYWSVLKNRNDASGFDQENQNDASGFTTAKTGTSAHKNRNEQVNKTGTNVPPESTYESNEEPTEARGAQKARRPRSLSGGETPTPPPTSMTESMLARALERAGWIRRVLKSSSRSFGTGVSATVSCPTTWTPSSRSGSNAGSNTSPSERNNMVGSSTRTASLLRHRRNANLVPYANLIWSAVGQCLGVASE